MTSKKSDDAISPVIGVMLMLVVTVVIAAVVTIFATGVVGETEAAPVAVLDVEILSNQETLVGLQGPELFITHLSGEAVDTDDIELRFSWTHDGCSHYSTYSAEGFKNSGTDVGRSQALYVKSTMPVNDERTEYGSSYLDHFFGDVILTPGLKLTANSEFLPYGNHMNSQFMDVLFDNYKISTNREQPKYHDVPKGSSSPHDPSTCSNCKANIEGLPQWGIPGNPNFDTNTCVYAVAYNTYLAYQKGICQKCNHEYTICTEANDPNFTCACVKENWMANPTLVGGIMDHLEPGTPVDVMIVHKPSNKAIYDKTVIVQ